MYSQPHPHALIFYQQPCSSTTVFFSLPQPSLQPQTIIPLQSNHYVRNWVVKLVRSEETAVATSHGTSNVSSIFHSTWSECCAHQFLLDETPLPVLSNQTKTHKPIQCDIRKIECSSKVEFEGHILGKKHKRNMQLQNKPTTTILPGTSDIETSSVKGQELFVIEGNDLGSKRQKLLSGDAAVDCSIACNNQEAFGKHLAEKMHTDQTVSTSHSTSNASSIFRSMLSDCCAHQETPLPVLPNQTKTHKPMQCEVCKIECSSNVVFEEHILGKKHKRNMQLQNTAILSGTSDIQTNSLKGQELLVIEGNDLGSKRQKLLSGAASVDCNIAFACNSQEAFGEHLAEKMHTDQVGLTSKKMKVAQSVWCQVCNIHCNTKDVYISHSIGKKHLKKLEKLSNSKSAGDGAAAAIVTTNATNRSNFC